MGQTRSKIRRAIFVAIDDLDFFVCLYYCFDVGFYLLPEPLGGRC